MGDADDSYLQKIEELQQKIQLYERIIEHAPVSIFVKDINKTNLINNERDRKTLKKSIRETIGKTNEDLFTGDTLKKINKIDDEVLKTGKTMQVEEDLIINGERRTFLATRGPFLDNSGQTAGIFGVSQEITKYKKIEELERQEIQMERAKTMMLGLSHDINNIVFSITSQAELLNSEIKDPKLQMVVQNIIETAKVATDLFKHLKDTEKQIRSNKNEKIDVNNSINELEKILNLKQYKDINFHLETSREPLFVNVGSDHLIQILMNIIINAIDSMKEQGGKLTIITELINLDGKMDEEIPTKYIGLARQKYAGIVISDTGEGISTKHINKLFTPFFSTKKPGRNSGLGLYITYDLIKHYDGEIIISTELGIGSIFEVLIPI